MSDPDRETGSDAPGRPTRRAFLGALAVAPLAPTTLGPQTPPPSPTPPPSANEGVAEALVEAVKREFGAYLDASELDAVKKEIAHGLDSSARLRKAVRLRNSDEPVTRFEARAAAVAPRGDER